MCQGCIFDLMRVMQVFADDNVILRLVFERHLVVNLVDSELFQSLADYLTTHQKETDFLDPSVVINELVQAKRTTEASAIDRACRGQQGTDNHVADACSWFHLSTYRNCFH